MFYLSSPEEGWALNKPDPCIQCPGRHGLARSRGMTITVAGGHVSRDRGFILCQLSGGGLGTK